MSDLSLYRNLAVNWQPDRRGSGFFNVLLIVFLIVFFIAGFMAMQMEIPEKTWEQKAEVPTRVANYIAKLPKKIEPVVELPKPKPQPPKPKPVEEPRPVEAQVTVARDRPGAQVIDKPLSQPQQQAREAVQNKGLLGLRSQLTGLTQDSPSTRPTRGTLSTSAATNEAARHQLAASNGELAAANDIDTRAIEQTKPETLLVARETDTVTTATTAAEKVVNETSGGRTQGRGSSDVASVFNRNKSSLNSLYERERRNNLALQGRVIFQLVIEPSGAVSSVKIVDSELDHTGLEARLSARIKQFQFAPSTGKAVTVTFPVEFRPS